MRPLVILYLMLSIIMLIVIICPHSGQAQYPGLWFPFSPFIVPWSLMGPLPVFFFGFSAIPLPAYPSAVTFPVIVEPRVRVAMAATTIPIPTVTITAAPLTSIINLLDPSVLASNIAVLTTNFPLVYNLLVTTYQLPIL